MGEGGGGGTYHISSRAASRPGLMQVMAEGWDEAHTRQAGRQGVGSPCLFWQAGRQGAGSPCLC